MTAAEANQFARHLGALLNGRDPAEDLQARLDVLNEIIYEPEGRMSPAERDRRIAERDRVYERLQELTANDEEQET
jgi:hypothetical protein